MGRVAIKHFFWLLFSANETFEMWKQVCNSYVTGNIMDSRGEKGKQKKRDDITVTMFRCFEGDISQEEIVKIFRKILREELILRKEPQFKHRLQSMHEYANDVKIERKLKAFVLEYLQTRRPEDFNLKSSWSGVCEKVPQLADVHEIQRLRRAAGENYLKDSLKRNKERDAPPITFTGRLDTLLILNFGGSSTEREAPFVTFFSDNLLTTVDPEGLPESSPQCPLGIADFGRVPQQQWSEAEIFVFLENLSDIPLNHTIVVAFFVVPGELFVNVHLALKKFATEKNMSVHIEYGSYRSNNSQRGDTKYWDSAGEEIIFAGISHTREKDWSETFLGVNCPIFTRRQDDSDFLEGISSNNGDGGKEESKVKSLLKYAPSFEMIGEKGGLVNPNTKPQKVIKRLVHRFSEEGDTILDFFSGGQVLKTSLLSKRNCYAFADTVRERNFLEEYGNLILRHRDSMQSTGSRKGSSVGEIQDALEIGPSESELLLKAESYPGLPGGLKDQPPLDETLPGGVDDDYSRRQRERLQAASVVIGDVVADEDFENPPSRNENDEAPPGCDIDDQAGEGTSDRASFRDPTDRFQPSGDAVVGTPGAGSETLLEEGEVGVDTLGSTPDRAETTGAAVSRKKAGGFTIFSPIADNSILSDASDSLFTSSGNKLVFLPRSGGDPVVMPYHLDKGKKIGEVDWFRKKRILLYWEWQDGPDKGVRLSQDEADPYLKGRIQTKYKLTAFWSSPRLEREDTTLDSQDLQSELGSDVRIDEFGTNLCKKSLL